MGRTSGFAALVAALFLTGAGHVDARRAEGGIAGRSLAPGFLLSGRDQLRGADFFGLSGSRNDKPALTKPRGGELSVLAKAKRSASPIGVQVAHQTLRGRLLDALFKRLRRSDDDDEAEGVADAIERVWLHSGSDTADLLMNRALVAMRAQNYPLCETLLGKIIVIDPKWAEAWNQRAMARFLAKDFHGAMADLAHVLALEPRHFGAMAEVGAILETYGDKEDALLVFRKALNLYPRLQVIRKIVDKLRIEVDGQDT